MLDLVQKSFGSEQVTPLEVFRVAATSMLFTASDDILRFLSQNNDAIVRVSRPFDSFILLGRAPPRAD